VRVRAEDLKVAPENVPTLVLAGAIELTADKRLWRSRTSAGDPTRAESRSGQALLVRATEHCAAGPRWTYCTLLYRLNSDRPGAADAGRRDLSGQRRPAAGFAGVRGRQESKLQESTARTRLGQIALARGDYEAGLRELEAATALDNAPVQADIALVLGYLRSKDLDRALDAAKAFAVRHPKDPMAQQLIGDVHLARREQSAARAAFERALELKPVYLPAVANLARLDLAEKKTADARKRFEDLLVREPKNELALLGLAEVMVRTGAKPPEVLACCNAPSPSIRSLSTPARADQLPRRQDARAAGGCAEGDSALRNDLRILSALAGAKQPMNRIRPSNLQPDGNTEPVDRSLMRLAAVHARRKDYAKSIDALRRAQKLAPDQPAIGRDVMLGYLLAGKTEDAIKEAKAMQAAFPKLAAGHMLEGDIYATTKRWPQAERAYREALKADPASEASALKLHGSLLATNKTAEADALAKKWLAEHPKDVTFRNYLAERARAKNCVSR
jgi:predicted Zn-dependent protease